MARKPSVPSEPIARKITPMLVFLLGLRPARGRKVNRQAQSAPPQAGPADAKRRADGESLLGG